MNIGQSISYCFSNYFNFSGRGSRSEYWWFFLFATAVEFAGSVWDASMGDTSGNGMMYWLAILYRRHHLTVYRSFFSYVLIYRISDFSIIYFKIIGFKKFPNYEFDCGILAINSLY